MFGVVVVVVVAVHNNTHPMRLLALKCQLLFLRPLQDLDRHARHVLQAQRWQTRQAGQWTSGRAVRRLDRHQQRSAAPKPHTLFDSTATRPLAPLPTFPALPPALSLSLSLSLPLLPCTAPDMRGRAPHSGSHQAGIPSPFHVPNNPPSQRPRPRTTRRYMPVARSIEKCARELEYAAGREAEDAEHPGRRLRQGVSRRGGARCARTRHYAMKYRPAPGASRPTNYPPSEHNTWRCGHHPPPPPPLQPPPPPHHLEKGRKFSPGVLIYIKQNYCFSCQTIPPVFPISQTRPHTCAQRI